MKMRILNFITLLVTLLAVTASAQWDANPNYPMIPVLPYKTNLGIFYDQQTGQRLGATGGADSNSVVSIVAAIVQGPSNAYAFDSLTVTNPGSGKRSVVTATNFQGTFVGDGASLSNLNLGAVSFTNVPISQLKWSGVVTGATPGTVESYLAVTNAGKVYYLTLHSVTNTPAWNPATATNVVKQWNRPEDLPDTFTNWPAAAGIALSLKGSGASPTKYYVGANGQPYMNFGGTGTKYMQGVFGSTQAAPYTVGLVFRLNETAGNLAIMYGDGTEDTIVNVASGNVRVYSDNGTPVTIMAADFNWHTILFKINGASSTWQVDGGTITTNSSLGSATMHAVTLANNNAGTIPCNVDVQEVVVWTGILNTANSASWFNYTTATR